jgi:hypothetical protein
MSRRCSEEGGGEKENFFFLKKIKIKAIRTIKTKQNQDKQIYLVTIFS